MFSYLFGTTMGSRFPPSSFSLSLSLSLSRVRSASLSSSAFKPRSTQFIIQKKKALRVSAPTCTFDEINDRYFPYAMVDSDGVLIETF